MIIKKQNSGVLRLVGRVPRVLVVFLGCFALATMFLAIESSSQGAELVRLEDKETALDSQNQELRSELVSLTSLVKISEEAQKIGMIQPEKLTYLSKTGSVGLVNEDKPLAHIP